MTAKEFLWKEFNQDCNDSSLRIPINEVLIIMQSYHQEQVKNNVVLDGVSKRVPRVSYCKKYIDENGLCKRCRLDKRTHDRMVKDCEEYNRIQSENSSNTKLDNAC